jgi:hypothetical protein
MGSQAYSANEHFKTFVYKGVKDVATVSSEIGRCFRAGCKTDHQHNGYEMAL